MGQRRQKLATLVLERKVHVERLPITDVVHIFNVEDVRGQRWIGLFLLFLFFILVSFLFLFFFSLSRRVLFVLLLLQLPRL